MISDETGADTEAATTERLSKMQIIFMVTALVTSVVSFQLNTSMLVPAIGSIESALGPGAYTHVANYFFLAGAIVSVVFTRWSDYVGRKRVLLGAMIVMCVGTVLCIVATSVPVMVFGRILQGGCVISFGLSYLILREHLSGPAFGACVGVISSINGGVGGIDALLGGLMVDHLGFRSIFVLILGVGIIAVAITWKALPADHFTPQTAGSMDWMGAAMLALAVAGVNLYLTTGGQLGWLSPVALVWIVIVVGALVGLVFVSRRVASPLIAVAHMRSRQVWPVITSITLALAGFYVVLNFIVPALAGNGTVGFAMSATMIAVVFLTPAALIGLASAPLAGWLAVRTSFVATLRVGILTTLVCTTLIALFVTDKTILIVLMIVFGVVYNGLLLTSASGMGVVQAPDDAPGSLPGISNACFGIGASIGFAWAGPFVQQGTDAGFRSALWICVIIGVVALVSSLVLQPKPLRKIALSTQRIAHAP